jgi:hypothetical protein
MSTTFRRLSTVLLPALAAVLVTSPASARPGGPEKEMYYGPAGGTASFFAGVGASGCGDIYKVFGEPKKRCHP